MFLRTTPTYVLPRHLKCIEGVFPQLMTPEKNQSSQPFLELLQFRERIVCIFHAHAEQKIITNFVIVKYELGAMAILGRQELLATSRFLCCSRTYLVLGFFFVNCALTWLPIGSIGFLRGSIGFLRVPMGSYRFLWVPLGSYGFLWVPMGS